MALTETEHLLTCLAEEAAEVIQAVSKAQRFGLNDTYRGLGHPTPKHDLETELADVIAVVRELDEHGIQLVITEDAIKAKRNKLAEMIEYAKEKGTICQ